MLIYEVPLSPQPQAFGIALGGANYRMRVYWVSAPQGGWVFDLMDSNGAPLISAVPFVTGADLLEQYGHLGIVGGMAVQSDYDLDAVPTFDNLGVLGHLYYVVPS